MSQTRTTAGAKFCLKIKWQWNEIKNPLNVLNIF